MASFPIITIGTDIVNTDNVHSSYLKYGIHGFKSLFTVNEIKDLSQKKNIVHSIAGHIAAKEAIAKTIGTGFQPNLFNWHDIEIQTNSLGKPIVHFVKQPSIHHNGKLYITESIDISITHTDLIAFATAIHLLKELQ